jgi:hypothetical protein
MQIPQRQHGGVHGHGQGWSGWSGWGVGYSRRSEGTRHHGAPVDGLEHHAAFLQNASAAVLPSPGFHPGLVCRTPLGHSKSGPTHLITPHRTRRCVDSGFPLPGFPYNKNPIPRSPPKPSTAHERQPDTPQYPGQQRDRAGASLGGEQPHPSRTARKLILPRASSATGGPIPQSPAKTRAAAG